MIHRLKTLPHFFHLVLTEQKTFELRFNDRNFNMGDLLVLQEWNGQYTGRELTFKAGAVLKEFAGLQPGYVIISLLKN